MTDRLAAVDLGTNSVLLTIVERRGMALDPVLERATVTRLGQGVDQTKRLHPEACARTLACLRDYRRLLDEWDVKHCAAVGTSALRDAEQGAEFRREASEVLGCELQVITGPREAALSFAGALSGLPAQGRLFVFDIGGGSTELVWGQVSLDGSPARIERSTSLDLGSVRLHERLPPGDPPSAEVLDQQRRLVRQTLRDYLAEPASLGPLAGVVGVAGTVTTLTALGLGLEHYDPARVHGALSTSTAIEQLAQRLGGMSQEERLQLPGLDAGRADVIVSGALLCSELLSWLGVAELRASDRGVRWGLLHELAADTLGRKA